MHDIPLAAFGFIIWVLIGYSMSRICKNAGYPGWIGWLALIPGVFLLLLLFIAFAKWPTLKTIDVLRVTAGQINPKYLEGALTVAVESYAKGNTDEALSICERLSSIGMEAGQLLATLQREKQSPTA